MRSRPFGQQRGCTAVVLFLVVLAGSVRYAWRHPLPGIGLVAALLGLGLWLLRAAARREREQAAQSVTRLRAIAPPMGAGWRALLDHEGLGRWPKELKGSVRPALRLATRPVQGALAVGQSRIGGRPDLPADLAWPEHEGQPMMFLAQLDLAEVQRHLPGSPLPDTGHLWFFYALSQPWGFDPADAGASRVLHRTDGVALVPTPPPAALSAGGGFPACALSFEAYEDLPPLDQVDQALPQDDQASERYDAIREYLSSGGEGPSHKLLGFADPIQNPMELECQLVTHGLYCGDSSGYEDPRARALRAGQADWRLLLQLDSDSRLEMMWGDAGRIYFWMRETDLRERRFEGAWLIQQCY